MVIEQTAARVPADYSWSFARRLAKMFTWLQFLCQSGSDEDSPAEIPIPMRLVSILPWRESQGDVRLRRLKVRVCHLERFMLEGEPGLGEEAFDQGGADTGCS